MVEGALSLGLAPETGLLSRPAQGMLCYARRGRGEGWREEEKEGRRGEEMEKLTGGHPSNLLSTFPPPGETHRERERRRGRLNTDTQIFKCHPPLSSVGHT